MKKLEDYVVSIPDFPEPGIIFRDITSILQDPDGFKLAIDSLLAMVKDVDFDVVVGAESRGFIFGTPVAYEMGKSFVPARKPGKLPRETVSMEYALEYGTGTIELHKDSIKPGQKVVIIDDLIATGGTVEAIAKLVEELGGEVVKICFVMELAGLKGREKLQKYDVDSALQKAFFFFAHFTFRMCKICICKFRICRSFLICPRNFPAKSPFPQGSPHNPSGFSAAAPAYSDHTGTCSCSGRSGGSP